MDAEYKYKWKKETLTRQRSNFNTECADFQRDNDNNIYVECLSSDARRLCQDIRDYYMAACLFDSLRTAYEKRAPEVKHLLEKKKKERAKYDKMSWQEHGYESCTQ